MKLLSSILAVTSALGATSEAAVPSGCMLPVSHNSNTTDHLQAPQRTNRSQGRTATRW